MRKISSKITLFVLLSCTVITLIIGGTAVYTSYSSNNKSIENLEKQMKDSFDLVVKSEVETMVSILQEIDKKHQNGEITLEEAKKLGADIIRNARFGKEGYFWTDTVEGVNVVLLGNATEGTNRYEAQDVKGNYFIKEIIANGRKEGGGFSEWWFPKKDGKDPLPKRGYSLEFKPYGWVVGTGNYIDDIDKAIQVQRDAMKDSLIKSITVIAALSLLAIIITAFVAMFISKKISMPINELSVTLKKVETGDLTAQSNVNTNDEIGILSKAINSMTEKIRLLISETGSLSATVVDSSKEILSSSENMTRVSDQVSSATNDLAKGATQQAVASEKGNSRIKEIIEVIEKVALDMEKSNEMVRMAKEKVEQGQKSIEYQEEKMTENKKVNENVTAAITNLSDKSNEIGLILEAITGIADQTNLLALNAAIEAARAGEQGRGFAVVAEEIRKLAEQSSNSVKKIGMIIKEVQVGVEDAVTEMTRAGSVVGEQEHAAVETIKAFSDISNAVENITGNVNGVTIAIQRLSKNARQAGDSIEEVACVAEETAASTEEVAASIDQQAAILHEIAQSSKTLSQRANELLESVNRFKI